MTKFSTIISYKEEMHLPRRNATISQKFMDNEECKNSWTRRNAKISYSPNTILAHTVSSA
jgi:hypothetical protein